jgi:hypothetical protein
MWEPRRPTTLWAPTACYRDSFVLSFFILVVIVVVVVEEVVLIVSVISKAYFYGWRDKEC